MQSAGLEMESALVPGSPWIGHPVIIDSGDGEAA
jgi:hypothetical protein